MLQYTINSIKSVSTSLQTAAYSNSGTFHCVCWRLLPVCQNSGPRRSLGCRVRPSRRRQFGGRLLPEAAGLLPRHGEPHQSAHTLSGTWWCCPVAMGTRSEEIRAGESDGRHRAQRWFWRYGVKSVCVYVFTGSGVDYGPDSAVKFLWYTFKCISTF